MAEALKKSDIEILVSTMNRNNLDFLLPMFPFKHFSGFTIIIVNQTTPDLLLESSYPSVRVINSFEKGLSKSRNMAVENAGGILGIVTDDDVVFKEDFEQHVLNAFNRYPDAALISFRIEKAHNVLYKKYPAATKTHLTHRNRLSIMSIEMVLNLKKIKQLGLRFNEDFGLGSKFCMGEEAIFVDALYRKGQQVVMEPQVLSLHDQESTHVRISVREKYFVQGALYSVLFQKSYFIWVFIKMFFDLKQSHINLREIPQVIHSAIAGRHAYKQSMKQNHK